MDEAIVKDYARKLRQEGKEGGYLLNPDEPFVEDLARGLLANEERYGYPSCPCRLSKGIREQDRDIICPCDYRDEDMEEYGACFCGLYVSPEVFRGERPLTTLPDRRKMKKIPRKAAPPGAFISPYPIWRCTVCGYICARTAPPGECPICHVDKERFELMIPGGES